VQVDAKMMPVESISGIRKGGAETKESGGGGEFNCDIFDIL
jgi:hypothetical protein